MLNVNDNIRKLSKCNYYQTIYSLEKNIGINLFKNSFELTQIQIVFLNYLSFYSALYFDFSMGEIDDRVFEDFIYEDAYMTFRKHDRDKTKEKSRDKKINNVGQTKNSTKPVTSQWVFKSPKKAK